MWTLLMVILVVVMTAGGEMVTSRPPVNGYAGVNLEQAQAVLVEPTAPPLTKGSSSLTMTHKPSQTRVPMLPFAGRKPVRAKPASLAQRLRLRRPKHPQRPLNDTALLFHRLQQQMEGKRDGLWKKSAGGLRSRRVRPGLVRLGTGSGKGNRRRRPGNGGMLASQRRPTSGVLQHRLAVPGSSQAALQEYMAQRQNSYINSSIVTLNQHTTMIEEPRSRDGTPNENKKRVLGESTKNLDNLNSSGQLPSVHDMTSMHYSESDSSSTRHTDQIASASDNSRVKASPKIRFPTRASISAPSSPGTKPNDGKDILGSIQSIFQAVKSDEGELTSMKTVSHGNDAPQPLDIFSGVSPSFGFQPSQPILKMNTDNENSPLQMSGTSLQRYDTAPEPIVAMPEELSTGDFIVHVGRPLPVTTNEAEMGSDTRLGDDEDYLLDDSGDNIIIGRPAGFIQFPQEVTSPPQPTNPPPLIYTDITPHFQNRQDAVSPQYQPRPSPPTYSQDNLGPLLKYIKTKYLPGRIPSIPSSVSSLQSIIQAGRIPQMFRREDVMKHIQNDHQRVRLPLVNRLGKPFSSNGPNRAQMRPQMKTETGGSGSFVALSSVALLAAFCGYLLFSGSSLQTTVVNPIKEAVDEARSGLNLILQGLDEYEAHLDKEKHNTDEQKTEFHHVIEEPDPKDDISTILTKIINKVVPPEIIISSDPLSKLTDNRKHVDASQLVRGNKQITSGYRQPHAIVIDTLPVTEAEVDAELSRINATLNTSIMRTTASLSSAASSLVKTFINSKTVRKIISQLKNQTLNARKESNQPLFLKLENLQLVNSDNTSVSTDQVHQEHDEITNITGTLTDKETKTNVDEGKRKKTETIKKSDSKEEYKGIEKKGSESHQDEINMPTESLKFDTYNDTEALDSENNMKNHLNINEEQNIHQESQELSITEPLSDTFTNTKTMESLTPRNNDIFTATPPSKTTPPDSNENHSITSSTLIPTNNMTLTLTAMSSPTTKNDNLTLTNTSVSSTNTSVTSTNTSSMATNNDINNLTTPVNKINHILTSRPPSNNQNHVLTTTPSTTTNNNNSGYSLTTSTPTLTTTPSTITNNITNSYSQTTSTTPSTPSKGKKLVILNNLLHVHHTPETDAPRTSAFLNNLPLRPVPQPLADISFRSVKQLSSQPEAET